MAHAVTEGQTLVEYVWMGSSGDLRSRTRVLDFLPTCVEEVPVITVDGSSYGMPAEPGEEELVLKARRMFPDPMRASGWLVLCDAHQVGLSAPSGDCPRQPVVLPASSNTREACAEMARATEGCDALFVVEQEYHMEAAAPTSPCWPPYISADGLVSFCEVGAEEGEVSQRGASSELWSYKLGPMRGLEAADQLWLSRWLMLRTAEEEGVRVSFDEGGEETGLRCYFEFSTSAMREAGSGLGVIQQHVDMMQASHLQHAFADSRGRLRSPVAAEFSVSVGSKIGKVSLPTLTMLNQCGPLIDCRPPADADPYVVVLLLLANVARAMTHEAGGSAKHGTACDTQSMAGTAVSGICCTGDESECKLSELSEDELSSSRDLLIDELERIDGFAPDAWELTQDDEDQDHDEGCHAASLGACQLRLSLVHKVLRVELPPHADVLAVMLHTVCIFWASRHRVGVGIDEEWEGVRLKWVRQSTGTQQLLMQQPWPHGLFRTTSNGGAGARTVKKCCVLARLIMSKLSPFFSPESAMLFGSRLPASNTCSKQPAGAESPPPVGQHACTQQQQQQELRVHMGIATGQLAEGTAVHASAVMGNAKVIADAGAGGQVLMDEATFSIVKGEMGRRGGACAALILSHTLSPSNNPSPLPHPSCNTGRLEELAAVDAEGMNDDVLNDLRPPWWMFWRYHDGLHKAQADALVLDMGTYVHTAAKALPPGHSYGTATAHSGGARRMSMAGWANGKKVSADGVEPKLPADEPTLHLYQLCAPRLSGRVKVFGNSLALKEEWVCIDKPYFEAPSAMEAPLGGLSSPSTSSSDELQLLPAAIVVAMVDGARALVKALSNRELRDLHASVVGVMRSALVQIPDGYLSHADPNKLTYTLVFPTPTAAAAAS
ncbi:hypothetical protein FOA52_000665 [Chlamydomonas sp. UWO 241]|nr:hypothetical protein FOA52_000665 [Chlamydomonas sp. UWO 241]